MSATTPHAVAILHFTCPPVVGGVESVMASHARLLQASNYKVSLVVGRGPAPDKELPGIATTILPLLDSKNPELLNLNAELEAGRVPATFATLEAQIIEELEPVLAKVDTCIVHNALTLHKHLPLATALHQLASKLPTRFISWCHDLAWTNELYLPVLHPGQPWEILRRPHPAITYVAISQQRRQEILATFQPPPAANAIPVIPNGISFNSFLKLNAETTDILQATGLDEATQQGAWFFLIPARLTRRKNIELAIRLAAELKKTHPVRLVVTGPPGPHNPKNDVYVQELMQLRAELRVEEEFIFLMEAWQDDNGIPRPLSDEVIADLYRCADALLLPSSQEGFGIPLLEAGILQQPIFCARLTPFLEFAQDFPHYFKLDDSPATIARQIIQALENNPQFALRRRVIENYTWESIFTKQIEPLINQSRSE